jgi:RNA polymerase sigma-70 factor (ECF subfamily)
MIYTYLAMFSDDIQRDLFEEIYTSNRKLMFNVASGIVPNGYAEDAVHNSFLRIGKHIEKFYSLDCNERRYLCVTIVRNISHDIRRKSHSDLKIPFEDVGELPDSINVADEILRIERLADIEQCIKRLEPVYRDVVDLRLVLGYDTRETAEMLGISQSSVKTRLHRGREKLKELLTVEGICHEQAK